MNKTFAVALLVAQMVGCAAEGLQDEELGQVEQPDYTQAHSSSYSYGAQTALAHKQCDKTSTSQVCSIPKYKVIEYTFNTGHPFSQAELVSMSDVAYELDQNTSFIFTLVQPNDPIGGAAMRIGLYNTSCQGTLTNNIEGYSCPGFTGVTAMNEGPGITWQVQKHAGCTGGIDIVDIRNKTVGSAANELLLTQHATAHALLTCMGLGSRDDAAANNYWSRRSLNIGSSPTPMTLMEKCRANLYQPQQLGGPDNIVVSPTACNGAGE